MTFKISKTGIELIKSFEGCYLKAYRCPAGVWTIGIGHTGIVDGKNIVSGMKITQQKAEILLSDCLEKRYEPAVRKLGNMNQNQYDALVSFCYNLGPGIFKGSLLDAINKKDWQEVARQMKLYNKARVNGTLTELKGLTRRRNAEAALLLKPIEIAIVAPSKNEQEEYEVKKAKIELNGKVKEVETINLNGNNYIRLRDLQDDKILVDYSNAKRMPVVKTL